MGEGVFAGALPGQPLSGRQGGACSGDAGTSTDRPRGILPCPAAASLASPGQDPQSAGWRRSWMG